MIDAGIEKDLGYIHFYEEIYKDIEFTIGHADGGWACTIEFPDFDEFVRLSEIDKLAEEEGHDVYSSSVSLMDSIGIIFRPKGGNVYRTTNHECILLIADCNYRSGELMDKEKMITRCHKFIDLFSSMTKHNGLLDNIKEKLAMKRGGKCGNGTQKSK